jgi:hypothetical protein
MAYLANLCNSTIIEIYSDIIQVSHGFKGCQMLEYIADTFNQQISGISWRDIFNDGDQPRSDVVLLAFTAIHTF